MNPDPMKSLWVVVPTFEPSGALSDRLRRFRDAGVGGVVVVDDCSVGPRSGPVIEELQAHGMQVLRQARNGGIGAALNRGVRTAADQGARFVLTVDQDSEIDPGSARNALVWLESERERKSQIWAACPQLIDDEPWPSTTAMGVGEVPLEPIQSGLILDIAAFDLLGGFREDLVIDGVDTEFWLRMLDHGMVTQVANGYSMRHEIGERFHAGWPVKLVQPGKQFNYHGPLRRYYMTRNRLLLVRLHGLKYPAWAVGKFVPEMHDLVLSLAYGPRSAMQAAAVAMGFLDSVRSRTGRAPGWLA